jgi:hypothetical protein
VAQKALYVTQARAGFQQARCEGVAKGVRADLLPDARLPRGLFHGVFDAFRAILAPNWPFKQLFFGLMLFIIRPQILSSFLI